MGRAREGERWPTPVLESLPQITQTGQFKTIGIDSLSSGDYKSKPRVPAGPRCPDRLQEGSWVLSACRVAPALASVVMWSCLPIFGAWTSLFLKGPQSLGEGPARFSMTSLYLESEGPLSEQVSELCSICLCGVGETASPLTEGEMGGCSSCWPLHAALIAAASSPHFEGSMCGGDAHL